MVWRTLLPALCLVVGLRAEETIRVGVSQWSTLNPILISKDTDSEATDLIFDRLVTLDNKGQFIPELLESWTVLKGGREVVLKLRPGLTWQDGRPIEAEDIVFTWRSLRLPRVRAIADTAAGAATLDSLTAEDKRTVRIRLARPRGALLSDLYNLIPVPRHLYQVGPRPGEDPINFQPVGSGPYKVVGKATNKRMLLQRWEGYRGPHPGRAASLEFWDAPAEAVTSLAAFKDGRLHFAQAGTSPEATLRFYLIRKGALNDGSLQTMSVPTATLQAYFLNCDPRKSLLGDVTLRQALAELIPWQDMARARRFFPNRLATGFWSPETWAYDTEPRPMPNPDRAVAILEAAGWKLGPDGIRQDAKGRKLILQALEPSETFNLRSPGKLLVPQAAKVGIRIDLVSLPFDDVVTRASRHEGDIWQFGWTLSPDPDVDSTLFTREGIPTNVNLSGYVNPEIDRLFDQGRHTLDPEARMAIYHEISDIIYRDKPVIPFMYSQTKVIASRRLEGVSFNILGQTFGFWPGRRDWALKP